MGRKERMVSSFRPAKTDLEGTDARSVTVSPLLSGSSVFALLCRFTSVQAETTWRVFWNKSGFSFLLLPCEDRCLTNVFLCRQLSLGLTEDFPSSERAWLEVFSLFPEGLG